MSRNLSQLQAVTDAETMLLLIKQWLEKSDNRDLHVLKECIMRTTFYVNNLEMQLETTDRLITEARLEVNRAVLRAQRSEERVEELEKEVKSLKSSLKAFGL